MKEKVVKNKKVRRPMYYFPYDEMPRNSRLVIYGASGYSSFLRVMNEVENYYNIIYYVDIKHELYESIKEIDVYSPETLLVMNDYDYVVISSVSHAEEIQRKLFDLSVPKDKIKTICGEDRLDVSRYLNDFSNKICDYYKKCFSYGAREYVPYLDVNSKEYIDLKHFFLENVKNDKNNAGLKMRAIRFLVMMKEDSAELYDQFCRLVSNEIPDNELDGFCLDFALWNWEHRECINRDYFRESQNAHIRFVRSLLDSHGHVEEVLSLNHKNNSNNVVVIVYHFSIYDGIMDGPTRAAVETCHMLSELCGYDVDLFVEDTLSFEWDEVSYYSSERKDYVFQYYNPLSIELVNDEDVASIEKYGFNVHFPRIKNRRKRMMNQIAEIFALNPKAVVNLCGEYSMVSFAFIKKIPLINAPLSGCLVSLPADVTVGSFGVEDVEKEVSQYNLDTSVNYHSIPVWPPGFRIPNGTYKKTDYGINENTFLMITVGVDLSRLIPDGFMEMMEKLLENTDDICWMIVGPDHLRIDKRLVENKKVIHIYSEPNLGELYQMADIYLNIPRKGGGLGIAEAIINELPILMNTYESDGMMWMGKENTVPGDELDLRNEIMLIHDDKNVYNKYKEMIKKRKEYLLGNKKKAAEMWKSIIEGMVGGLG
ncbi:MAG: hypothetical protein VZQ83_00655 [Eubacterium sp.]|nr:hypothetical protein [Eubacterium sp.]